MGLKVHHRTPGGDRVLVDSDVLDLDRRLKEGDATCGWRGDPLMWLAFNTLSNELEVFGIDAEGVPYVAASEPQSNPNWRHDLLARVVRGDWQRGSAIIDGLLAERDRKDAAKAKDEADAWDEKDEKFAWALKKELTGESINGHFFHGRTTKEAHGG